ncbi:DUF3618 domain-containing protein [Gordonia sp. PKS22-38]|uniref:DUF3618 domain-containing protein n=1 Tax=Gordonia prachuapensis TaxID=3115651 RepID=A0ABU7MPC0_9ACTN|nr:DUF3618 domain-containing protein [Gordonia sp. PKS22-38]
MTTPSDDGVTDDALPPVEQQRAELAETVDALARKADVKARVQDSAADLAQTARNNQNTLAAGGAAALGLVAVLVITRRWRRNR